MSGHSKWHSIKHKKGIEDAKRGRIFTKHAHLIAIAARQGGDPDLNPALRIAIDNARAENLPFNNIERAIKRGTGELKEGAEIAETQYEGFGPRGIVLLIQAMTDNKNRTVSNIRNIVTKHGGNLGGAGATAWMFEKRGNIVIDTGELNPEDIELQAIECGASDFEVDGKTLFVFTSPSDISSVKVCLEKKSITVASAKIEFAAKETVHISDEASAKKILALMEALEDDEDVVNVASNFDIDEEIMAKIMR